MAHREQPHGQVAELQVFGLRQKLRYNEKPVIH